MRLEKCWFCSATIYPGKGSRFVRGDCKAFNFCRSKCFKLFKLRLNPRKIKWTKISRVFRGKEVAENPINEFEKRMDVPQMYDREKTAEIVETIPKIIALRNKIEAAQTKDRIYSAREKSKEHDVKFMKRYERLLDEEKIVIDSQKLSSFHNKKKEMVEKKAEKAKNAEVNLN